MKVLMNRMKKNEWYGKHDNDDDGEPHTNNQFKQAQINFNYSMEIKWKWIDWKQIIQIFISSSNRNLPNLNKKKKTGLK